MTKSSPLSTLCSISLSILFSLSSVVMSATLSESYRNDVGINTDPNVLFSSDFESDLTGWSNISWADPTLTDKSELMKVITSATSANGGNKFLESKVTKTQLKVNGGSSQYISAQVQHKLAAPTDIIYVRFYTRFVGLTEMPHHWIRLGAGNSAGGQANTVPNGNASFWFDLDIDDSDNFNFYAVFFLYCSCCQRL